MPKYQVERSIIIECDIQRAKESLSNYTEWKSWSPWIIMEADAKLEYSPYQGEVGSSYGWDGEIIGTGEMNLLSIGERELSMKLSLTKPFKSESNIKFILEPQGNGVKVTWYMSASLPFFLFWMKKKIQMFIGMDYERGLMMLKEHIETGTVSSRVDVDGTVELEDIDYIGIPGKCHMDDIGKVMKEDYDSLEKFMSDNDIKSDGYPFSIYTIFDMENKRAEFISCIPIDTSVAIDNSWVKGTLRGAKTLCVTHTGSYEYLANAWMTAFTYIYKKKMRNMKMPVGYEFYHNNPAEVEKSKLVTKVYLPLR